MNKFARELPARVEQNIEVRALIAPHESVLLAVSGGVDSMVLLHVLAALSRRRGWNLLVAHLNHQLRGRAANADEALVRQTSEKMGLACITDRADISGFAKRNKLSAEMAGRKLRHEFLARVAEAHGISTIALAHHADDQVELFFLRLLRGSGPDALGGMKWKAPSPANPKLVLIRPLLDQSKAALTRYAVENAIAYREDVTNRATDYLRNRIRNELLPLLRKEYQSGLDRTILRVMDMIGAEAEWASASAQEVLTSKVPSKVPGTPVKTTQAYPGTDTGAITDSFTSFPLALQRRLIQLQIIQAGAEPDFDLVEALRVSPNEPVSIGVGKMARRTAGGRVFFEPSATPAFNPARASVDLSAQRAVVFENVEFLWKFGPCPVVPPRRANPGRELFDAASVGRHVILRHWQPGDRFQPVGMACPVKLQDIFGNQKVLRKCRYQLILATTSQNEVFWVEGLRIAERFKLTGNTRKCLEWRWKRLRSA